MAEIVQWPKNNVICPSLKIAHNWPIYGLIWAIIDLDQDIYPNIVLLLGVDKYDLFTVEASCVQFVKP